MKVFFYSNGSNGVSHYRQWQPAKYLARVEGVQVKRLPDFTERIQIPMEGECNVPGIGSHDSITALNDVLISPYMSIYKEMGRLVCQARLKPLVIDIDDDILNIDKSNPNYRAWHAFDNKPDAITEIPEGKHDSAEWKSNAKKFGAEIVQHDGKWFMVGQSFKLVENVLEEIKAAALVTVSTQRLKDIYSRYNSNVQVIPNAVDFEWWPKNNKKDDGFIRLGLFGSNTHYKDWNEIAEVLKKVLDEFPNVKLCFNNWFTSKEIQKQGASLEELKKTPQFPDFFEKYGLIDHPQVEIYEPVEIQKWSQALSDVGIDIGLAPLSNLTFNKAKSNLKYLEFSALRIPGVYEKMEPYQDDIKHGENGFLASHPVDWYKSIKKLVEDSELRKVMGNRAWQDVKNRYDQANISRQLAEYLQAIHSKGVKPHEESIETRASRAGLVLAR